MKIGLLILTLMNAVCFGQQTNYIDAPEYVTNAHGVAFSGKVSFVLETNWVTTSKEYPVRANEGFFVQAVYVATGYHETGTIVSNTVAKLIFKGKEIPVVVESVEIGRTNRVTWR